MPVAVANPRRACEPLSTPFSHSEAIVVERGSCTFLSKVRHARDAGASIVIIVNDDRDMAVMGADGGSDVENMTVVKINRADGLKLISTAIVDANTTATINCIS